MIYGIESWFYSERQVIRIPPKDTECCAMNVFITETGNNLGYIEKIKEVNIESEIITDYERDNHGIVTRLHDSTYEMTFNSDIQINTEEFYKILGIDTSNMPDAYDIQFVKFVQARKHKNRRINKKWLKRYGYKQTLVDTKGWKVKTDTNGKVEFIKQLQKIHSIVI